MSQSSPYRLGAAVYTTRARNRRCRRGAHPAFKATKSVASGARILGPRLWGGVEQGHLPGQGKSIPPTNNSIGTQKTQPRRGNKPTPSWDEKQQILKAQHKAQRKNMSPGIQAGTTWTTLLLQLHQVLYRTLRPEATTASQA